MPDGTSRFSYKGQPIFHYMGCSTFSNFTVLPEIAVAKIREDAPFKTSCYIGCGVTTGVGAVVNTAKVEPGANVVVFGLGGIGLNVIQGAKLAGANKIVGVDINPDREEWGRQFGMTHFLNPKGMSREDIVAKIVEITDGGADYTFDSTGNTEVMRKRWNAAIAAGARASSSASPKPERRSRRGRSSWSPGATGAARRSAARRAAPTYPRSSTWYMDGKIEIDPMITHILPLDEINKGFDLMHAGESIRSGGRLLGRGDMYSHMMFGSNDRERSQKFYNATMGAVGLEPRRISSKVGRVADAQRRDRGLVTPPINGEPAPTAMAPPSASCADRNRPTRGTRRASRMAARRSRIRRAYASRLRQMYLAYLRDPDGNKLCAF